MNAPIGERDWKYLRSIYDEMLHALCARINQRAIGIATEKGKNTRDQYLKLYRYIQDSDDIIADCFNDWRRSNISVKALHLRRHGLLSDQRVQDLSAEAQDWLRKVGEMEKSGFLKS